MSSVQFIEPDFARYPKHKKNGSLSQSDEATTVTVDPIEDEPTSIATSPVHTTKPSLDVDDAKKQYGAFRIKNSPQSQTQIWLTKEKRKRGSFARRVSFDTIATSSIEAGQSPPSFIRPGFMSAYTSTARDKEYSSYFLAARHDEYKLTYGSRTFLCSITSKSYSESALIWLMDTLLHDNDELVLLRLYHENTVEYHHASVYQKEAGELIDQAVRLAQDRNLKINIQLELGVGKIKTVVHKMLALHQPSIVIVGSSTKVTSNYRRMRYRKNISSYLIAKSPVPVVVVTPRTAKLPAEPMGNEYFASLMELTEALSDNEESDNDDDRMLRPVNTNNTNITTATSACSESSESDDDDDTDDIEEDDDDDDDDDDDSDEEYLTKRRKSSDSSVEKDDVSGIVKRRSSIKSAWKFLTTSRSPSFKKTRSWSLR